MRRLLGAGLIAFGIVTGVARVALRQEAPPPVVSVAGREDAFDSLGGRGTATWPGVQDRFARPLLGTAGRNAAAGAGSAAVRRISRDTTTDFDAQHETQVEPDSLAVGSTIVSAFQNGRFEDGGAAAIGWATTADAGKHWRTGVLAQTRYAVVSDPVVAYDAVHESWLIGALGRDDAGVDLWLSRSRDGIAWSAPVVAADNQAEGYDKEWIACDNSARSPYHGRCYLAYVDSDSQQLRVRRSLDGGVTWSAPVTVTPGPGRLTFTGPFAVIRPDGTLVIPYSLFPQGAEERIAAVVSEDGASSFEIPVSVAPVDFEEDADLRAEVMPSADVDAAGKVYAVWSDSNSRADGVSNDIVLSTSANGFNWSSPVRIPLKKTVSGLALSYFLPAIAVAPTGTGRKAKLAVVSYSIRLRKGCEVFVPGCRKQIEAWLVRSNDGGRTWGTAKLLSSTPMLLEWVATSTRGHMLGDYVSVSWAGGRPWAIIPMAAQSPLGYAQAIFAATAS